MINLCSNEVFRIRIHCIRVRIHPVAESGSNPDQNPGQDFYVKFSKVCSCISSLIKNRHIRLLKHLLSNACRFLFLLFSYLRFAEAASFDKKELRRSCTLTKDVNVL
jgi:hypothetical protein